MEGGVGPGNLVDQRANVAIDMSLWSEKERQDPDLLDAPADCVRDNVQECGRGTVHICESYPVGTQFALNRCEDLFHGGPPAWIAAPVCDEYHHGVNGTRFPGEVRRTLTGLLLLLT